MVECLYFITRTRAALVRVAETMIPATRGHRCGTVVKSSLFLGGRHMGDKLRLRTDLILLALVVLDVLLSGTTLLFPSLWFRLFHGAPYIDPQALLRRTGAVWVAFTLLQFLALVRWKKQPHWLVLIA